MTGYDNEGFSSIEGNGVQNMKSFKEPNFQNTRPSSLSPSYSWHHPIQSTKAYLKHTLGDTKLGVHILVCVFAIASWADLNSMWSELPQLSINLPEAWDLPSFIIIISQIANIGPLIYVLLTILLPANKSAVDKVTCIVIIVSDIVAVFLVAFFWKHTSHVAGEEHSTALLSLNFVFALGDCTSSLAFFAFMSTMKPAYMATYFLGEGLSGMLPAFIALGQGVSDIDCVHNSYTQNATYPNGTEYNETVNIVYPMFGEPNFSVKVYFIIIAVILMFSGIAFVLLNVLTYCKSEMVTPPDAPLQIQPDPNTTETECHSQSNESIGMESKPAQNYSSTDKVFGESDGVIQQPSTFQSFSQKFKEFIQLPEITTWNLTFHMTVTVIINMTLTTFLASIQSYTTLPYGLDPYHMATNLAQITNPVACFLAVFVMASKVSVISVAFFLGEAVVVYIIYATAMSPTPPLHGEDDGGVMIVALWVIVTFFLIYAKVCVAGVMREYGRRALIWLGVATQAGSLVGAITGFVLVNHYKVFKSAPYC